jgi:hypothetical protein
MLIPEFVLPPRELLAAADRAADSTIGTSASAFEFSPALFSDTDAGPLRFWRAMPGAADVAAGQPVAAPPGAAPPAATPPATPSAATTPRPEGRSPTASDTGFRFPPSLFHETGGGPLRFWRAQRRAMGDTTAAVRETRRSTEPRLLGRPVPFPAPRRDTMEEVRRDQHR